MRNVRSEQSHDEGRLAKTIEEQAAKLPSDLFLWAAMGSIAASLVLMIRQKKEASNFVGHWVPTFLLLGVYNKIVKTVGSNQTENSSL